MCHSLSPASLLHGFLDLLFPPRCQVCSDFSRELICGKCQAGIRLIEPPFCAICGRPFEPLAKGAPVCSDCRQHAFRFDRARSAGLFDGALREAIHAFKYQGKTRLAEPLAELMIAVLCSAGGAGAGASYPPEAVDAAIPVPLHPRRRRERGFNQSELLARAVGKALELPVDARTLQRIRPTRPQIELKPAERQQNVRGAFALSEGADLSDKTILLIDDVFTTGATLSECARVLRTAGVRNVFCLTLARPRSP